VFDTSLAFHILNFPAIVDANPIRLFYIRSASDTVRCWCDDDDDDDDDVDDVDRVVGRVVLGSFMFSRGKELEHWNRMTASANEQIVQWHGLL